MSYANCLGCSLRVKSAWPVPIREDYDASHVIAVSYTHLTLPTIA